MLDNAKTPNSPDWWLLRLGGRLAEESIRFDKLESYWQGRPPVPHGNQKMREAYRRLQNMARTNFASLIVESLLERMKVVAFRSGGDGTDQSDKEAWKWWQTNGLDADHGLVHRAAVMMSRSYVIVGKDPKTGQPLVTGEDPRQVIHESSPTNRRDVLAALKTWWDDISSCQRAVLYLPNTVHYYVTTKMVTKESTGTQVWAPASWQVDTGDPNYPDGVGSNPLGDQVPVTVFVNRPDLSGGGLGEFEDVIDILDRINTVVLDRLVISAMQAYRQRWAKGIDVTDESGNPQTTFDPGADLLWAVPDEHAQFGEFHPTDIGPVVKAIESDVQYLSAITRTPPHYLLGAIVNASGDALGIAESGLVSKLLEREGEFGESWERVYRQCGIVLGHDIPEDAEVVWKDPQFRTLTEMASAALQLMHAGVPWRTRMRFLDMSPQEIDRMETERAHDALLSAQLASLSVAEGGEVGTRGVSWTGAGPPTDANAMRNAPAPTKAAQPAANPPSS